MNTTRQDLIKRGLLRPTETPVVRLKPASAPTVARRLSDDRPKQVKKEQKS